MAYQSLYRRYRPQTFSAIRGQPHVVAALQGAVRDDKVGHAYLLHGPRGTGKTTSARILAKALNCENLGPDGEPCTECESCQAIEQGRSFDLHELDAASNNGVDDMRELIARVNLGTPGRAKVYLLDEAHMLTRSASNALLKTLEEPPDHVTWVLATTEPHKMVETIRSRCQVFELGLLGATEMAEHVRWVIDDAGLEVADDVIDYVVAEGRGSVRDALSALDRVVAAGGHVAVDEATERLIEALATRDTAAALAAVGDATGRGRDPRTIGELALAGLRDAFLTAMGAPSPRLAEVERTRAESLAATMAPAAMTRALETLGTALVDMRQAPDPRVDLEVALVRLCRPETDRSLDALLERVERLERRVGIDDAAEGSVPESSVPTPAPPVPPPPAEPPAPPVLSPLAEPDAPPVLSPLAEPDAPDEPTADDHAAGSPDVPATGAPNGPAAARQALAATKKPAGDSDTVTTEPSGAAPSTARPTPSPAPPPVPADPGRDELAGLRPGSARELVELAARHLGLAKDVVVARAQEMLEPRTDESPRDPAELVPLWEALVGEHRSFQTVDPPAEPEPGPDAIPAPVAEPDPDAIPAPVTEPDPDAIPAPVTEPDPDAIPAPVTDHAADRAGLISPTDHADIDLDDLIDAPTQTEDVIGKLTEAFPGAELITTDDEESR